MNIKLQIYSFLAVAILISNSCFGGQYITEFSHGEKYINKKPTGIISKDEKTYKKGDDKNFMLIRTDYNPNGTFDTAIYGKITPELVMGYILNLQSNMKDLMYSIGKPLELKGYRGMSDQFYLAFKAGIGTKTSTLPDVFDAEGNIIKPQVPVAAAAAAAKK